MLLSYIYKRIGKNNPEEDAYTFVGRVFFVTCVSGLLLLASTQFTGSFTAWIIGLSMTLIPVLLPTKLYNEVTDWVELKLHLASWS